MRPVPVLYLASYTLSLLGNSIAAVVFPLIVLQLTGSLLATGVLVATTALPSFLAGLFAGVVLERAGKGGGHGGRADLLHTAHGHA